MCKMNVWLGGLVVVVAAGLYLFTLDNGLRPDELTGGDLITHQYAQVEARPGNAPGYPLYTMGGWLWFRLGRFLLGWAFNPIQILSLYSTWWALASLLVLYFILLRVGHGYWLPAWLLTAFYATTYFFWYYSVTTEQYTSAVLQTLLIIWLAFKWDETPRDSILLWLAFISGTMLANMLTTLFILPPLLWFVLFKRDGGKYFLGSYLKRPKLILQAVALALLPLCSYAYVYWRGAQYPQWRGAGQWPTAWAWFVQFLTIQQGRDELAPGLTWQNIFTAEFPALMGQELTWLVFGGGLLGLAFLGRRRAIFLYSTLLIYFIFAWLYRFGNWFQVIIPAYPIFVIGFVAGLIQILQLAHRPINNLKSRPGPTLSFILRPSFFILVLLTGLLLYRFAASLPRTNQRNLPADTGLDPGWAILADQPGPSVISGDFAERVALQYLKTVWGVAPLIYPTEAGNFDLPQNAPPVERVYITRRAVAAAPQAIEPGLHPQAAGEQLIALWPAPRLELPPHAVPAAIDFGQQLKLVGWQQIDSAASLPDEVVARLPRANWQVALYWQASTRLTEDYTVSVRPLVGGQLVNVAGENLMQDHQPVWGVYPTGRWRPGEVVRDVYALFLPEGLTPETMQLVVYRPTDAGFENLTEAEIRLKPRK
ncbi:MAG: DUF2723 domain-containing protein [Anaerolineae bacterium]|nr:DUF2723 domain-containing protein [Anaerolineae bacterium]